MKNEILELEFADPCVKKMRIPAADNESLPDEVRRYHEALQEWYHARGFHKVLSADDVVARFPTFIIRVAGFTLEVQGGGEVYPKGFAFVVFNPQGVAVDEVNFMHPEADEKIPEKLEHGAPVVDWRKLVKFFPTNDRLEFIFYLGSFRVSVHSIFSSASCKEFSLYISRKNAVREVVCATHYIWFAKPSPRELMSVWPDGTSIIDARKPMVLTPSNPKYPPFIPPTT